MPTEINTQPKKKRGFIDAVSDVVSGVRAVSDVTSGISKIADKLKGPTLGEELAKSPPPSTELPASQKPMQGAGTDSLTSQFNSLKPGVMSRRALAALGIGRENA